MSNNKTALHISFLLGICALFGLLNFAAGWIFPDPSSFFPDVVKSGDGVVALLASNGSRQLGIAVLLIIAAFTRRPGLVTAGLIVRLFAEFFDIVLYAFLLQGKTPFAILAAVLFVWEIFSLYQITQAKKEMN